jgi:hypothetical protein
MLPGACCFDGGIQRDEVGLLGDRVDEVRDLRIAWLEAKIREGKEIPSLYYF